MIIEGISIIANTGIHLNQKADRTLVKEMSNIPLKETYYMFQIITIIVAIISLVLSFLTHPKWSWVLIGVVDLIIVSQFWVARQKYRFKYVPELSSEANDLLKQFGHYFAMPFASKDFSASAATSQFAGIILAVVSGFMRFWWAIAFAVLNWFLMGFVASSLSPASLLDRRSDLDIVHDQVFEYVNSLRQPDKGNHDGV